MPRPPRPRNALRTGRDRRVTPVAAAPRDLSTWIEVHAELTPARAALRWQGKDISYADLARRIERTAVALAGRYSIGRGDRVAILAYNCPQYIELLFACARLGAILGRPDDPALLVYTSGTTGRPKGAVHTQATVAANTWLSVDAHEMTAADRILTFLPMFHTGGLNNQTVPALSIGATVILQPRFAPDMALAAIMAERPTLLLLVPAVMKAMIEHLRWRDSDLSSVRFAMAGSSIVPVDLIRAFHRRNVPVGQIYGATETGPVSIVLKRADALRKEGSCGLPALDCEVRVVDEAGHDVAGDCAGEILIRAPNVMTGYWRDPAATAEALAGGWYHTGDIGHRDSDGYFWIDERKKDVIISGGENIYPAEIEAVLDECPAIAEAAVVARPDPKWGEVPVVVAARKPGAAIDAAAVKALFSGRLARFKHPHDVVFIDALPRNVMGKVLRYKLRKLVHK
ncbi:MAG: AMP-binding protein [Rhodospirillales bacterium]|nr:AMP-binding protein [Rhodospirillales bacterium]